MAISIIKQPAEISWSRNPIRFEFQTDMVIQDQGRPVIFELDFTNVENVFDIIVIDENESLYVYPDWGFKLHIGSTLMHFSCEYGNGYGKFSIPHRIAEEPTELKSTWLLRVRDSILNAFNIGSLFTLDLVDEKLIFTAKKNDQSLVISLENDVPTLSIILNVTQTGTSINYTPNLKIYCELFSVGTDGKEYSIISAALAPDLEGRALWDFSKPLTSVCLTDREDVPDLYNVVYGKFKSVRQYYVHLTELYGEPQLARMSVRSDHKRVAYGGLPKNMLNTSLTDSLTEFGVTRFLRTTTNEVKVLEDQQNWLSWINIGDDLESIKVQVELTFNDGTPYIFTPHTYQAVNKYDKLIIPVGLNQLGANDFYPELSIVSYTVTLKSTGNLVSNVLHFNVDRRNHLYNRFFLFQNSLGAFETFYTYGRKNIGYEIESEKARVSQVQDFVLENGEDTDFDIQLQEKEKINTGWKSKGEIRALRDFFMSKDKLTLIGGKWWPISVSSSSIEEFEDGNGLYALSFEISIQHTQEMFFDN
ncbi:hypothetical protein [Sphingobacterium kitahiroshimense]|uniref:hypothetical protein n=1 Tax=Sphingobacterium kitahiroshimense TaxID=470446 RepID=UPI00320A22E9